MPIKPNNTVQSVDRGRRSRFVARVVSFSLVAAVVLAVLGGSGVLTSVGIVANVAIALLTGGFSIAAAYIGGSVVDYTWGKSGTQVEVDSRDYDPSDGEAKG